MKYLELCEVYEKLEGTSKGLEKTKIIANFLKSIKNNPDYIYLLQGKVFPDYDSRELGMSSQLVIRAISKAVGYKDSDIISEFKKRGDLGFVADYFISDKKRQTSLFSDNLIVKKVFDNLKKISSFEGKGTVDSKINLVVELLHSAKPKEARYIIRTVLGDLRVGVGSSILRDSIVEFCFKPKNLLEKKEFVSLVQEAYDRATDFSLVFKMACNKSLEKIILSPGKPVKVMLYPKAKDAEDAFRIVGKPAAFEYKYDGFRVIINKDDSGKIMIFTRSLEEVTSQFPDLVEFVSQNVSGKNFIIDGEVIGYDEKTKKYKEFQTISQRIKRKYDINRIVKEIPVELKVFDILFYNGKDFVKHHYIERRKLLEKIVSEKKYKITLAKQIITDNEKKALEFFDSAISDGQEGLMVKGLDKKYKPGARIGYGVKWKPKDNDFDLIITGAEWGTGKRAGWLTSFDVSCKNNEKLLEIGKVSTGLKEKEQEGLSFVEMTNILKDLIVEEHGRRVRLKPKIVVTVQYQNIQKSPAYSSGYALRFPRITGLRPDRSVSDIATIDEVIKEANL